MLLANRVLILYYYPPIMDSREWMNIGDMFNVYDRKSGVNYGKICFFKLTAGYTQLDMTIECLMTQRFRLHSESITIRDGRQSHNCCKR